MLNKVIILGKPNVGKSSLFNVMLGKKMAIEDNFSGLTRDLKYKKIKAFDKNFDLIDSPGIFKPKSAIDKKNSRKK